jgi:DeoR family transcriptional regulator, aga operon transcriptional repressor
MTPRTDVTAESADQASRWQILLDSLALRQRLSVAEASELLGVSPATVRRDFRELARQQLATRTHGGVVATFVAYDLPARYRTAPGETRERIARAAAGLVEPGRVVGFNGGTTTSATARHLAQRPDLQRGGEAMTVVTNALNIAGDLVLRPHIRTVGIGGVARPESYELHGPFAARVLADLLLDHLILGVDGVSSAEGASCHHLGESGINAEMVAHARQVTVVAEAHKLEKDALSRICGINKVDRLVTDDSAEPAHVAAFRAAGVEVTLA